MISRERKDELEDFVADVYADYLRGAPRDLPEKWAGLWGFNLVEEDLPYVYGLIDGLVVSTR